jgi:hypothetical protein
MGPSVYSSVLPFTNERGAGRNSGVETRLDLQDSRGNDPIRRQQLQGQPNWKSECLAREASHVFIGMIVFDGRMVVGMSNP